jgi:hypothetical protein
MSYRYIADSPVGAVVLSIILGPLGLQGWVINPNNKAYGNAGVHMRRISYAIHIFLLAFIILILTQEKKTIDLIKEKAESQKVTTYASSFIPLTLVNVALGSACLLSFIFSCILLSRST